MDSKQTLQTPHSDRKHVCDECDGDGQIVGHGWDDIRDYAGKCTWCGGTGEVDADTHAYMVAAREVSTCTTTRGAKRGRRLARPSSRWRTCHGDH